MSSAIERIEKRLSGKKVHPFDWVNNPVFFDPQPDRSTPYWKQLISQAKLAYLAGTVASRGLKLGFVQGSMSNGSLAYDYVDQNEDQILRNTKARTGEAYKTTQRLKHNVASSELMNRVMLPNRHRQGQWADTFERRYPDEAIVPPVDLEGALRSIYENHALSQGASFQDFAFECFWVPKVDDTRSMHPADDHAYSRYANAEEIEADAIQCGFLDDFRTHIEKGEGRYYEIKDEKGRDVPLSDRAWETAKHIVDVVERGFRTDYAVAALVSRFQIDDWLNDPDDSPLDMSKVHPVLKKRSKTDKKRMTQLKELMLPYLAEKCANWMPYQNDDFLKDYFETKVLPTQENYNESELDTLKDVLFSYLPRGGFVNPRHGAGTPDPDRRKKSSDMKEKFSQANRAVKRRGTKGDYFESTARLFEDYHYEKLNTREKAALSFVLGAMEVHRLPEGAAKAALYVCDPKGGERAADWAEKNSIEWLKEAQRTVDPVENKDNFFGRVVKANVKESSRIQEALADSPTMKQRRAQNVVSTLDFLTIDEALQKWPEAVATPGPNRISSRARLAMQMEWMDRNAEIAVFRKGWENNPAEIQLMMRAVLHVTGLADRPYNKGGDPRMEIFVHDESAKDVESSLVKQDLCDIIETLSAVVEKQLSVQPPVPDRESYVTMARLLEISDKLSDPGARNRVHHTDKTTGATHATDIINWNVVDADFKRYWYQEPDKREALTAGDDSLRDRVRGLLLTRAMNIDPDQGGFQPEDLDGLDEEYAAAFRKVHGLDRYKKRRKPPMNKRLDWRPTSS